MGVIPPITAKELNSPAPLSQLLLERSVMTFYLTPSNIKKDIKVKKNLAQDATKFSKKADISKSTTRRQSTSKTSETRQLSKNSKPKNSIMNRAKSPPV